MRPKEDDRYIWRSFWNQTVFKNDQNISDLPARDCRALQRQLGYGFTVQKISFAYERDTKPWAYETHFLIPIFSGTLRLGDGDQWLPRATECSVCGQDISFDINENHLFEVTKANKQQLVWTQVLTQDNFEKIELQQRLEGDNAMIKVESRVPSHLRVDEDGDTFKTKPLASPSFQKAGFGPDMSTDWPEFTWEDFQLDHTNELWSPAPLPIWA